MTAGPILGEGVGVGLALGDGVVVGIGTVVALGPELARGPSPEHEIATMASAAATVATRLSRAP
jgi:hypothetical protein